MFSFRHILLLVLIILNIQISLAQTKKDSLSINLSGYLDVFYSYDFNQPDIVKQPFLFNYNRHNTFNLNLGVVKLNVSNSKYRANLALQAGTYASDNYGAEPILYRPINEANIGIALDQKEKIWIDAGIFGSHLGFESCIGIDNPTLTRSLSAENSPYFLSGIKLTHKLNKKWTYALIVANGWQRIQRVSGNSLLSGGTQLTFNPSKKISFNWSTFATTEDPDSTRRMMYFNDLYSVIAWNEKWHTIIGFDYGIRQISKRNVNYDSWYNLSLITQYLINENWSCAARVEYFNDPMHVIINTGSGSPFETIGFSFNVDKKIHQKVTWRTELRVFSSPYSTFLIPLGYSRSNASITTSIAMKI